MNLPYGNGEICTPTPSEYLYAGLQRDEESGLDHADLRQYSSVFGQWTTPDLYGGSGLRMEKRTRVEKSAGRVSFSHDFIAGVDDDDRRFSEAVRQFRRPINSSRQRNACPKMPSPASRECE